MRKNVVAQRMKEGHQRRRPACTLRSIDPCQGEADFDRLSGERLDKKLSDRTLPYYGKCTETAFFL